MYISATFKNLNTIVTGLSPTVDIWRVDDSTQVVNGAAMPEIGSSGVYVYDFSTYDETKSYQVICDGGATLEDRYALPATIWASDASDAELAKIPKSDASVSWNVTALNAIRDEIVDDATRFSGANIALIKAQTDDQPAGVKKNVALSNFIFVMVNSSDNISPKTSLTVTTQISKDGASFVNSTNSASEIGYGFYKISFTQAEMNYDTLGWKFSATGANQRNIVVKTSE